jgi:hypothetical protein
MKSISKDLVKLVDNRLLPGRCLRGVVHLLSGGPVEPGVVDGEASKDA